MTPFEQLIRNPTPGQAPDLRIGGDTTDWTWWPLPGVAKPPGIRYSLSGDRVQVMASLTKALGARVILGINLELDSSTDASAEARALVSGIGRNSIEGLELGNEPELYGSFTFYELPDTARRSTAGRRATTSRPTSWTSRGSAPRCRSCRSSGRRPAPSAGSPSSRTS